MPHRGTTRTPGTDPTRLPIGLDLRALSIAEGVRAGLAAALPVAAAVWLHLPLLSLAALGALLTCICDPGGPLRRRLPLLVTFVIGGALLLSGFGLIRAAGIPATLAFALPALFATAYARIWGAPAAAIGNLLAVVLLLGTDDPLPLAQALRVAATFAAGGAWALLLTLALWRIYPYGPARRAVADVWDALARKTQDMLRLVEAHTDSARSDQDWEAHARATRGAVRNAMERARTILMETLDTRGPASSSATLNLMRLEAADQVFVVLIALSDQLEHAPAATRHAALPLLRRLRALLRVLAIATEREHANRADRLARTIAAIQAEPAPALHALAAPLAERLRTATRLIAPAHLLPGTTAQLEAGIPLRRRLTAAARANLTWRSATLRHAVRVCLVTTAALAFTLARHGFYTHWLTITLVLVMQPFFATTWQRTLERVGGTLLGGAIAAALSAITHSRLNLAGLLPVLGALALAVRQVSYGVYIAVYTPVVILLVEQIRPHESQIDIALARAGYTIAGGLIAILANLVLWPAWQPAQVAQDLRAAITAHAAFARAVLQGSGDDSAARRRQAGLASNNLEASLQRAMHEPRRGQRNRLQATLAADGALRRIAGRLSAISVGPKLETNEPARAWVSAALLAAAEAAPLPARPPAVSGSEPLDILAQQVELLSAALEGSKQGLLF